MSSEQKNNTTKSGIGFTGLLTIVFIVLKLCGVIGWSWWWVLSPLWIGVGLVFSIWVVFVLAGILIVLFWRY